jgi:hypothetical protein
MTVIRLPVLGMRERLLGEEGVLGAFTGTVIEDEGCEGDSIGGAEDGRGLMNGSF